MEAGDRTGGSAPWAALLVCSAWFAAVLWWTAGAPLLTPDSLHYGLVARSLLEGRGFVIEVVPFHPGWFEAVTRLPEMHGLLRPFVLWPFFAVAGPESGLLRVVGFGWVALGGVVAFAFARRLFGASAGWLALVLTLSNGVLFFFGWAGTDDVGFACLFLASLYAFHRGLESGGDRWFAAAGLAAGLAMLEKLSGVVLPATFAAAWLLLRNEPTRPTPRRATLLLLPFALALGAYLLRNVAAHGGLGFRFSPLAWMLKAEGYAAFHALYEQAPTLGGVIGELGWVRVPALALGQLGVLLGAVFALPEAPGRRLSQDLAILALGLPSLLLHARSQPRFAMLGGLAALGSVAFFCAVHHVEARYFAMLVPLSAVSLGGVLIAGFRAERVGLRVVAGIAAVILLASVAARLPVVTDRDWIEARSGRGSCPQGLEILARESGPEEVVLSLDPWRVAWESRRPAVMLPAGPPSDVRRVAAHYGAGWLLAMPAPARPDLARRLPSLAVDGLGAEPVLPQRDCPVYRISPGEGLP